MSASPSARKNRLNECIFSLAVCLLCRGIARHRWRLRQSDRNDLWASEPLCRDDVLQCAKVRVPCPEQWEMKRAGVTRRPRAHAQTAYNKSPQFHRFITFAEQLNIGVSICFTVSSNIMCGRSPKGSIRLLLLSTLKTVTITRSAVRNTSTTRENVGRCFLVARKNEACAATRCTVRPTSY